MKNTTIIFSGKKNEMKKCMNAFLKCDGDFDFKIKSAEIYRKSLFKHEFKVEIENCGKYDKKRFLQRVSSAYSLSNGNILGLLDYM